MFDDVSWLWLTTRPSPNTHRRTPATGRPPPDARCRTPDAGQMEILVDFLHTLMTWHRLHAEAVVQLLKRFCVNIHSLT